MLICDIGRKRASARRITRLAVALVASSILGLAAREMTGRWHDRHRRRQGRRRPGRQPRRPWTAGQAFETEKVTTQDEGRDADKKPGPHSCCCLRAILHFRRPASRRDCPRRRHGPSDRSRKTRERRRFAQGDRSPHPKKEGVARSGAMTRGLSGAAPSGLASLDDAQLLSAAHATSRSIYGADDRKDWYQVSPAERVEPLARASVALFDASKIDAQAAERFASRPSPSRKSGTFARRRR